MARAFTEIHCHMLPYVDDGASTFAQAQAMLQLQIEQGVSYIYVTPHLRTGMFETSNEKIIEQFRRLKQYARTVNPNVTVKLGREYFCDRKFIELLSKGHVFVLSKQKHILVEFSSRHSPETILRYIKIIRYYGYRPVVAHIERYLAFQNKKSTIAQQAIALGAMLQIQAESVLGLSGLRQKAIVKHYLKQNMVHFIASDAHGTEYRQPNLGDCADYLEKRLPKEQFETIFYKNPNLLKEKSE